LEFGDTDTPAGLHAVSDRLDVSPDGPVVGTAATADTDIPLDTVETASAPEIDGVDDQLGEFNDDPIDTKLDLARAYLDMGDEEGARAMLDEVLKEGSQMQKDVATACWATCGPERQAYPVRSRRVALLKLPLFPAATFHAYRLGY